MVSPAAEEFPNFPLASVERHERALKFGGPMGST